MAITTPFFFFLRRSLTIKTRPPRSFFNGGTTKPYSSSQSSLLPTPTDHPKTSLSARMSFVFDQIDAIEKDRSGKDEALQRIRAWKEKKKTQEMKSRELGFQNAAAEAVDSNRGETEENKKENLFKNEVEVVHPWPEWIELMERLVHQNYFDLRKKDNDQTVVDVSGFTDEGFDFTRDWLTVRTACLNFGRDRFDILRSLSRKDIQILVGHGCPSVDAKAVFSAKLLRKHVHLDEGDVCSSCSLRNSCDRAFILTLKEDEARTLDIMRILLTFGFDPIIGSVENKPLMKMKSVKTVVRKLLHEVVKLSAVPIDPNLPPPVFKKPPPKVKQPPPQPKKRVGRDDIEMKKGDWLCPKCDFMNFAKNTVCLQCDAKRPKRQLLPGEWECPECNFLNYRRNMSCFHCEHKRPPDEFMDNQLEEKPHGPRTRLERVARMPSVSNAWNFDFDDNESDGADVAAFEFADPPKIGRDSSLDGRDNSGDSRGFEHDSFETSRMERIYERGRHSEPDQRKPTGFSDFDDEDDDIDSYELDLPNNNSTEAFSSTNVPGFSESNDSDDLDHYSNSRQRGNSRSYDKPSQLMRGKLAFADSEEDEKDFDSDKELSVHPNWKSSHIADSRPGIRNRSGSGPYKGISFGSDDELDLDSDDDDEEDIDDQHFGSNRRGMRRRSSDSEDGLSYGKDSDDDSNIQSHGYKMRGNKGAPDRRGNSFRGRDQFASARGARHRSNDMMSDRKNSFGNGNNDRRGNTFRGHDQFASAGGAQRRSNDMMSDRKNSFGNVDRDRSFRGSGRNDRESKEGGYGGRRSSGRVGNLHDFDRPARGEGFRDNRRGKSSELSDRSERGGDFGGDRPRRRIIER